MPQRVAISPNFPDLLINDYPSIRNIRETGIPLPVTAELVRELGDYCGLLNKYKNVPQVERDAAASALAVATTYHSNSRYPVGNGGMAAVVGELVAVREAMEALRADLNTRIDGVSTRIDASYDQLNGRMAAIEGDVRILVAGSAQRQAIARNSARYAARLPLLPPPSSDPAHPLPAEFAAGSYASIDALKALGDPVLTRVAQAYGIDVDGRMTVPVKASMIWEFIGGRTVRMELA